MNKCKKSKFLPLIFLAVTAYLDIALGIEVQYNRLSYYKCDIQSIRITNIDVISREELSDSEGQPITKIGAGMVEVYVTREKAIIGKKSSEILATILEKMNSWKAQPRNLDDGAIVGLAIERDSTLVFIGDKSWLLVIGSNRILSLEVEVVIETGNVRIATSKQGAKPIISDDKEIISSIFGLLKNPE